MSLPIPPFSRLAKNGGIGRGYNLKDPFLGLEMDAVIGGTTV